MLDTALRYAAAATTPTQVMGTMETVAQMDHVGPNHDLCTTSPAAYLSLCCQGSQQTSPTTSDDIGFSIEMQCCERKADNRSSTIVLVQRGSDGDTCIDSVGVRCAEISCATSAEASSSSPEFVFACSTVQTGSIAVDEAKPVFQTVSYLFEFHHLLVWFQTS